ncbi:DNA methyltransferase [Brevibacterium sp.]|uniref:DNA methyltransferase n=1 Tax=Brevibacterium sp. TaxID=1701 RepID=UPI002810ADD5|nr:DNA methyltransferase [Brevibacterium sp.]
MTRGQRDAVIDAVNGSTHVHGDDQRRIEAAMRMVARANDGFLDPNKVRDALTNQHGLTVDPRVLSARYSALAGRKVIKRAGSIRNLDAAGRNQGKPMWLYEVVDEAWLNQAAESPAPAVPERSYMEFLKAKAAVSPQSGFDVAIEDLHPRLFEHQKLLVRWALAGGCRAVFAAFGIGKSIIQLEILRQIKIRHAGPVAIVAPLGVRIEFANDAEKLGVATRFIQRDAQVDPEFGGIYLTNYESVRDGKLTPGQFTAVSLDEASILRSFGSKTYQEFLPRFAGVRYRFVATATPSPNRYKELIHYAGFLGVMDTGQALTRFFQRDSTKANNLRLYPHKEREFWLWLNTWAAFIQTPADLGCDATGYDLPPLEVHWREVEISLADDTVDRDGQGHIFRSADLSIKDAAREKRISLEPRVGEAMSIISDAELAGEQSIIWCDLNDEQDLVEKALAHHGITYSTVRGSQSTDEVERQLMAWKGGETSVLVGKPVMLGQGMNLQQARTAVFVGVTYKFNDTIQAVHRIHRYGQTRTCHVHLIHSNAETGVVAELKRKWQQHEELTSTMTDVIQEHGLDPEAIAQALVRSMGVERIEASGEGWLVANNDCVEETRGMPENEVDLVVTSIPFSNHYEYTPSYNDFGHTDDNAHFWEQMDFLTPELHRILKPGRIYACHVKDRILFGSVTGAGVPTVSPFHAEALQHGIKHGFDYLGMITVVTDVVRENNQTYRLGYTEMRKDGTKMGAGSPEYILLFHKPQTDRTRGYADEPVTKTVEDYSLARWQVDAHAFWRSSGQRHLTADELAALPPEQLSRLFTQQTLAEVYDFETHIKVGEELHGEGRLPSTFMALAPGSWHPDVWHDVNRMLTLNTEQSRKAQTMHVCPLQFDIVDRLIERYSNPGDLVFDPFGGLFTVPLRALKLGRRGRAVELNSGYFLDGVKYLEAEERQKEMPSLFDLEMSETA